MIKYSKPVYEERNQLLNRLAVTAGLVTLAIALALGLAPNAYALSDTCGSACSVSVSPVSGSHGTGFDITTTVTVPESSVSHLFFLSVITPGGEVFNCGPNNAPCGGGFPSVTTGTSLCTIPYGAPGVLSSSGPVTDCSGSNGAAWVQQTTVNTIALLEAGCATLTGTYNGYLSPTGVGQSTENGVYTVIACWANPSGTGGLYSETTFSVFSGPSVPEFPLGFSVLLLALVPALVILKKWGVPGSVN